MPVTSRDPAHPRPGAIEAILAGAVFCALPQGLGAMIVGAHWPSPIGLAPALGLAVALSTVWGMRALPGVAVGLLAGALMARAPAADPASLIQTVTWTVSATIAATLSGHALRMTGRAPLSSLRATGDFLLWGVVLAGMVAAVGSLPQAPATGAAARMALEATRMATGVLVFAPLGLTALQALPEHGRLSRPRFLAFAALGLLLLAAAFAFPKTDAPWSGLAAGLILPLLIWGGTRLPASVAIVGNATAAVLSAAAVAAGQGPFRNINAGVAASLGSPESILISGFAMDLPAVFAYAVTTSLVTLMAIGLGTELVAARHDRARPAPATGSPVGHIRALLDSAPLAASLMREDGTLVFANGRCAALLGCTGRDLAGADMNRFFVDPADRALMLHGLEHDGRLEAFEYRLKRTDGTIRWIEESWAPMDGGGQPLILAWSADVTERKTTEEHLRTSERRLRAILDESPAAVVISRPGGRILYANPKAAGLVGLPRALLIGADGRDFYADPGQRHRLADVMGSGGAVVNEEVALRAADGRHRTCLFSLQPMEFDGAPARLAWCFDITFRKQAEEDLRKSEARLRAILEASPLTMAVIDRRGRLRYANSALLDQFALEAHEAIGLSAGRLIATPLEARALRHRLLTRREDLRGVEAELRRADGSTFWSLLSTQRGLFEGEPALFAWAADITTHKEAKQALSAHRDRLERAVEQSSLAQETLNARLSRELEERKRAEARVRRGQVYLRTVLDTVVDGIITIDAHGLIEDINPAAERLFGYDREMVVGRNVSLLMPEPDRSRHDDYIARFLRGQGRGIVDHGREVTGLRADGRRFPLYLAVSAAQVGQRTLFTGVLRDITDQKRAEATLREAKESAELANRAKSEFLANMSHELRTPLNAIIGFSEMIKSEILGPVGIATYKDYAGDIHLSGRHLLDVINDILDIARIEAGRITLHEEDVDLATCAVTCLKLIQPRAEAAGLRLTSTIPDTLPYLRSDARRVKQMLLNLLSNAVKFTPSGGEVSLSISLEDGAGLAATVADTGIGMSAQDTRDALKPFVQVDSSLARRYEGTGLGLPLVAAMAELHDGRLTVDSAPQAGTRATLHFPAARLSVRRAVPATT